MDPANVSIAFTRWWKNHQTYWKNPQCSTFIVHHHMFIICRMSKLYHILMNIPWLCASKLWLTRSSQDIISTLLEPHIQILKHLTPRTFFMTSVKFHRAAEAQKVARAVSKLEATIHSYCRLYGTKKGHWKGHTLQPIAVAEAANTPVH